MKRFDATDFCMYVIVTPLTIIAVLMMTISFIGLLCQKESLINQNEYCVVLNKDSHLTSRVSGGFVAPRRVTRITAIGLTTQDTVTIDVDKYNFADIEIGDTIKTINLK